MTPSSAAQKFPSISHPLSRLGSRDALSITGKSRDGAVSVDWSLGSPSPQPPARAHSVAGSNLSVIKDENKSTRSTTSHDSRRISTEEILVVLEEKVRAGSFHSVKKLFRSNDPNGEGNVTKEAFSRILWNLCGYLSPRKISHVLKRMGLDKQATITFEDLVTYFRRPSTHGGATEPMIKLSLLRNPPYSAPERFAVPTPKSGSIQESTAQYMSPAAAADYSWKAFKAMTATGQLRFEDLFPPMCFGDGAYIIPGQLRECLQKLEIPSSDDIVARILRKLDGGSPYAIRTSKLFQQLGLNSDGKLPPKTPCSEKPATERDVKTSMDRPETRQTSPGRPKTSHCSETLQLESLANVPSSVRPKTSMDFPAKIFDGDVIDFVSKKLDEGQAQFIRALESKSSNSSSLISKVDLRNVLKYMGYHVSATTLEHLLAKNGLRRNDGVVNYRLLVRRLQTRSGRGTLFKVMKNQDHVFHDSSPPPTPTENMTASLLETKLLDIFHREFLSLLSSFRELDPSGTGLLTENEFKTAIEARFGISITPNSWEQLLSSGQLRFVQPPNTATQGQKGYIPYNDFLAKFDVMLRPSTVDAEDPWVENDFTAERLKEHKDRYLKSMDVDPSDHTHRHEPRPLDQLEATMLDVFLYKFHNFKKEYDLVVREDFCRVDKEKFDYILFRCGFVLTPSELSRLWLSMPITRPMESLSMPTILQQVMRIYYSTLMPGKFNKSSRDSAIVSHVLEKIRAPIVTHWNLLKKKLRYLDPMGTSRIEKTEMLQILKGIHVDISELELHYLIEMLESRIPGKTNYFRLMEYYVKNSKAKRTQTQNGDRPLLSTDSQRVYSRVYGGRGLPKQHDYRYPTPQKPDYITLKNAPATPPFKRVNVQPGVAKFHRKNHEVLNPTDSTNVPTKRSDFKKYRGTFEFLARHPPSTNGFYGSNESLVKAKVKPQVGARDLPFMGRAMRKEDTRDCGRISVEAFLKILSNYGVSFRDPNEIYKLMSRYDRKMRDEISYEKFLKALA